MADADASEAAALRCLEAAKLRGDVVAMLDSLATELTANAAECGGNSPLPAPHLASERVAFLACNALFQEPLARAAAASADVLLLVLEVECLGARDAPC